MLAIFNLVFIVNKTQLNQKKTEKESVSSKFILLTLPSAPPETKKSPFGENRTEFTKRL